jgi:outer membrane protein assembly factor BamB
MNRCYGRIAVVAAGVLALGSLGVCRAEDWGQFKFDARRSGNVAQRSLKLPPGLVGAVGLTDAILTSPVVAEGRVFAVDAAGTAFGIDAATARVLWKRPTAGGRANCNNVSSPAVAGHYLHFGTTAGTYYVLNVADGTVVKEIACGEPIFSSPVVSEGRVYFATLGARVYALEPNGTICWTWDFVKEKLGFQGDRWSGQDWLGRKQTRVTPAELFCCSRDIAAQGETLVIPAGAYVVWLKDGGEKAEVQNTIMPRNITLGLTLGEDGTVYRQWTLLDNGGRVDVLRPGAAFDTGRRAQTPFVGGTETNTRSGSIGFASVSLRGADVYRCRPEEGFGLCRHHVGQGEPERLSPHPALAAPILLRDQAVYGGLDGSLYVVPLAGGQPWSFKTAFGKAITTPVAVADGRVIFGCDDGYLYILGPDGSAALPTKDLEFWKIRSPLTSRLTDARYDRFTSFGNWSNTNVDTQGVQPPLRIKWLRRFEGTAKHFPTFGGGRMYTHTAEGQIFAVEQETGRLLWRQYYPGVHISYTSPLYYREKVLVPQAGEAYCRLRCLDAATGKLLWEAPFSGSPSWNRQLPPVVYENMAIYMFSTGRYGKFAPPGRDASVPWLFGHQENQRFPRSHEPLVRAYDLDTGKEVWTVNFSQYGAGGDDAGLCLMDGTLYYSCYFGLAARDKRDMPSARGLTAALDPRTGRVLWQTTEAFIHGGCTLCGLDGRFYLGGYNKLEGGNSLVWCVDARNGSVIWKSEPVREAIQVVTIGSKFLFVHAQYQNGFLLDKQTGKILTTLTKGYKCSRFTLSEPYLLGPNLDVYDLSDIHNIKLISTGPRLDPSECIGAVVSNGRIFYSCHAGSLQACALWGDEVRLTEDAIAGTEVPR